MVADAGVQQREACIAPAIHFYQGQACPHTLRVVKVTGDHIPTLWIMPTGRRVPATWPRQVGTPVARLKAGVGLADIVQVRERAEPRHVSRL